MAQIKKQAEKEAAANMKKNGTRTLAEAKKELKNLLGTGDNTDDSKVRKIVKEGALSTTFDEALACQQKNVGDPKDCWKSSKLQDTLTKSDLEDAKPKNSYEVKKDILRLLEDKLSDAYEEQMNLDKTDADAIAEVLRQAKELTNYMDGVKYDDFKLRAALEKAAHRKKQTVLEECKSDLSKSDSACKTETMETLKKRMPGFKNKTELTQKALSKKSEKEGIRASLKAQMDALKDSGETSETKKNDALKKELASVLGVEVSTITMDKVEKIKREVKEESTGAIMKACGTEESDKKKCYDEARKANPDAPAAKSNGQFNEILSMQGKKHAKDVMKTCMEAAKKKGSNVSTADKDACRTKFEAEFQTFVPGDEKMSKNDLKEMVFKAAVDEASDFGKNLKEGNPNITTANLFSEMKKTLSNSLAMDETDLKDTDILGMTEKAKVKDAVTLLKDCLKAKNATDADLTDLKAKRLQCKNEQKVSNKSLFSNSNSMEDGEFEKIVRVSTSKDIYEEIRSCADSKFKPSEDDKKQCRGKAYFEEKKKALALSLGKSVQDVKIRDVMKAKKSGELESIKDIVTAEVLQKDNSVSKDEIKSAIKEMMIETSGNPYVKDQDVEQKLEEMQPDCLREQAENCKKVKDAQGTCTDGLREFAQKCNPGVTALNGKDLKRLQKEVDSAHVEDVVKKEYLAKHPEQILLRRLATSDETPADYNKKNSAIKEKIGGCALETDSSKKCDSKVEKAKETVCLKSAKEVAESIIDADKMDKKDLNYTASKLKKADKKALAKECNIRSGKGNGYKVDDSTAEGGTAIQSISEKAAIEHMKRAYTACEKVKALEMKDCVTKENQNVTYALAGKEKDHIVRRKGKEHLLIEDFENCMEDKNDTSTKTKLEDMQSCQDELKIKKDKLDADLNDKAEFTKTTPQAITFQAQMKKYIDAAEASKDLLETLTDLESRKAQLVKEAKEGAEKLGMDSSQAEVIATSAALRYAVDKCLSCYASDYSGNDKDTACKKVSEDSFKTISKHLHAKTKEKIATKCKNRQDNKTTQDVLADKVQTVFTIAKKCSEVDKVANEKKIDGASGKTGTTCDFTTGEESQTTEPSKCYFDCVTPVTGTLAAKQKVGEDIHKGITGSRRRQLSNQITGISEVGSAPVYEESVDVAVSIDTITMPSDAGVSLSPCTQLMFTVVLSAIVMMVTI
eukprot:g6105.t1